ncbi:Multidrug resistance protein MdtA [Pseudomonas fluorescens]|uniref:Multidrug resistance protein MdtA n=1 Tax=Pseudomonas fluorescens TaxID=294 RepID=A0A5E6VH87_PSEFL|nr:efflux RND transporter periplasmic adaptor subunit [Pseudomonas fluorescens]VVN17562.1 Multidrug resistance protein MdtA [Pseudomonas fluorescens]
MPHFKIYRTLLSVSLSLGSLMIAGGATYWLWPSQTATAPSPASVPVTTAEVGRRDVPVLIHAIGYVRSLRSVDIRSQVDGLLLELPVSEGQFVKKGELLARMDDRGIAAALEHAKAQRAVTQAQLVSATLDLKRYRELASINAVSAQILDQQLALVAQLQATIKSQDATVLASQVQLTHTRIHSPLDGRVGIRNVHEGSYVRASDAQALFSVVQLDPISIESALPQSRLPQLQALMNRPDTSSAVLRAHSAHDGTLLGEGRLELIDNRVSADTGTVRIKGTVANPLGRLWPDQSIVINLQAGTFPDALVVPQRSLRQGAHSAFVWRISDGKAFAQPVQVEYADTEIAVVDGLEAGDQIVTDGYSRLTSGATVKIVQSAEAAQETVADRSTLR